MKKLLIPLILLVLGVGGGVGAGLALAPAPEEAAAVPANPCGELPGEVGAADPHAATAEDEHAAEAEAHGEAAGEEGEAATAGHEYVRLDNQFVVPVVMEGNVASMVLLSLSVEVPTGQQEPILSAEPKLRDAFLQVLFDHANTGGFEGIYTSASAMRTLRQALLAAAQGAVGETVTDVLIVEIVRQDT